MLTHLLSSARKVQPVPLLRGFITLICCICLSATGSIAQTETKMESVPPVVKDTLIAKSIVIPKKIDRTLIRIDSVIQKARTYWGIQHASRSNSGLDCSGLMQRSYAHIGVKLERNSRSQVHQGIEIPKSRLRKGDLVFFKVRGRIGHVGMVVSEQGKPVRFIHTSASQGVKEDDLEKKFWTNCYVTGRRILYDKL